MMHSTGLRAIVGRPSGRRLVYLAAAIAAHAWLRRGSGTRGARRAADDASAGESGGEGATSADGGIEARAADEGRGGRVEAHAPGSTPSEAFGGYNDRSVAAARDRQAEPADRWRPSPSMGGDREPAPDATASGRSAAPADANRGRDETAENARGERERGGAGISDLAPSAEEEQQSSLPPRGQRKPGYHA